MARRQHLTLMVVFSIVAFLTLTYMLSDGPRVDRYPASYPQAQPPAPQPNSQPATEKAPGFDGADTANSGFGLTEKVLTGGAIAPKLENATAKAELGRATWKFLHTMMARFPDKPTEDDSLALKSFIHLFARLYPCGQCAAHFQKMLKQYPPQVSSRTAAAGWACFVHNEVNTRLHKPLFDCSKIGDFYDCGCGDDKKKEGAAGADGSATATTTGVKGGGEGTKEGGEKPVKAQEKRAWEADITIVREGYTRGG